LYTHHFYTHHFYTHHFYTHHFYTHHFYTHLSAMLSEATVFCVTGGDRAKEQ